MEPTQLSQQDEALRRAQLDDKTRAGLRYIAVKLADRSRRPHALLDERARLAIALTAAEYVCGGLSPDAEAVERALLLRLPHVDRPITRGEYALIVNRAAWSAR